MPFWFKVFLGVHIAAGVGTFVLAPIALVTAKGGKQHRRWGMVYLWCMGIVAGTALPMAIYAPILFLALVAVFSFYAAFAGYRVLRLKDLPKGGRAKPIDWIAGICTFCSSAVLAWLGLFHPEKIQVIGIVGVAFGAIGMRLAYTQLKSFILKPKEKMFWWYEHLSLFIGSYIASWSAFSAVTLTRVLGNRWYVWLWPSIIGVPCIIATVAYYKRKFDPKKPAAA
jgi:uncharacterized membrane protein